MMILQRAILKTILFLAIIATGLIVRAQTPQKVWIIQFISPERNEPGNYLGISLSSQQDTSLKKELLTDEAGKIHLSLPERIGSIHLKTLGRIFRLDTTISLRDKKSSGPIVIHLSYLENQLSEVSVQASKGTLFSADKTSYRISDFTIPDLPVGKNLLKVLPGVSFVDNSYKIDGSFEPVFFINGARVIPSVIENLPTSTIERVEIIRNSTMTSGLRPNQLAFNVVTKKVPSTTLGGILTANHSFIQTNFGGYASLFLTGKKFFINLMLNSYKAKFDQNTTGDWRDLTTGKRLYARNQQGESSTVPQIGTLSMNFDATEKLQINYSLTYNNIRVKASSESVVTDDNGSLLQEQLQTIFRPLLLTNFANLALKTSKDASLFFRAIYSINDAKTNLDLAGAFPGNQLINHATNRNDDLNLLLGHDFKLKKASIEFGALYQRNTNSNSFEVTNNMAPAPDGFLTYNQSLYSLYLKLKYSIKKLTLTLNNRIDLNHSTLNEEKLPGRLQYLPTVSLYLPTKKAGSFSLTLSRQIVLPGSDDLAENQRQQTIGIISSGSTLILPQTNWSANLTHNLSGDSFEFTSALVYERVDDLIAYGPYLLTPENLIRRSKINVHKEQTISLRPSINVTASRRFSFTCSMQMGYYHADAEVNGNQRINNSGYFIMPSLSASLANPKFVNMSLGFSYRNNAFSPFEFRRQQAPAVSFTLSKSMLKKSLTLSASVYDALNNSNNTITTGIAPTIRYQSNLYQPFRSVGVSVSYLFQAKAFRYGGSSKGIKARETKSINFN